MSLVVLWSHCQYSVFISEVGVINKIPTAGREETAGRERDAVLPEHRLTFIVPYRGRDQGEVSEALTLGAEFKGGAPEHSNQNKYLFNVIF